MAANGGVVAPANPDLPAWEEVRHHFPEAVQCLAYQIGPHRYRAVCVDFSLVAESDKSMLDAQNRLGGQIIDYVADAIEEGFPARLLSRSLSANERLGLVLRIAGRGLVGLIVSVLPWARGNYERAVWREPIATFS